MSDLEDHSREVRSQISLSPKKATPSGVQPFPVVGRKATPNKKLLENIKDAISEYLAVDNVPDMREAETRMVEVG